MDTTTSQTRTERPQREPSRSVERVAAFIPSTVVRVPAWFTAEQALRVAELKSARRLLIEGRTPTVVSRDILAHAPANDIVLRWAQRVPSIDAEAPLYEARRLLAATGAPCLCVERGPMLLGTVDRDDLPLTPAGSSRRQAA